MGQKLNHIIRKRSRERTVATVRVDRLAETKSHPYVDSENVQRMREVAVKQWSANGAHAEDKDFNRMRIFCRQTEGRTVLVVNLVDVLV